MLWSPLGGGRLFSGGDAQALAVRGALEAVAHTRGISLTTAALAWLLRHPSRPLPVIGTRRLDAAEEALAATRITLSPDEWYAVLQASRGKEVA
jgi:predicted oxidoreductase